MTTTFTPAPSCSPPYHVQFGRSELSLVDVGDKSYSETSVFIAMAGPCTTTEASLDGCVPSGSAIESQHDAFYSTWNSIPRAGITINYYSPGTICPSGYYTVGVATKSAEGAVSSSGSLFVAADNIRAELSDYFTEVDSNVVLENLIRGESAIGCCPRFAFLPPCTLPSKRNTVWG